MPMALMGMAVSFEIDGALELTFRGVDEWVRSRNGCSHFYFLID